MNILFILHGTEFVDNLGIALLSAVAKKLYCDTFLTVFSKKTIDDVVRKIQPHIICYSSMSTDSDIYIQINRYLKSKYTFISIMGGPHPTFFPEVIQEKSLDYICRGEGELAFAEFLTKLGNGEDVEHIENFCSEKTQNPLRNLIQNLDELPFPDRGFIFDNTELGNFPLKIFMSSRGCPFPCSYCFNPLLKTEYKGKGSYVRTHSVDRVIEEIRQIKSEYPLEFIKFEDDLFGINASWLEEFSRKYKKEIGLPFNCLLRVDAINKDKLQLLKEAHCHSINVAIDSANARIRKEILHRNMKLSNEQIIRNLLLVKEHGINLCTNTIIGVPTSSFEDEVNSVNLNIAGKVDFAAPTILVPYPRTSIWYYCKEHNFLPKNDQITASLQEKSILTCFTDEEKNIQVNLFALYPIIVKYPYVKNLLIWFARTFKPNIFFSAAFVLSKSYLMKTYLYPCKIRFFDAVKYLLKALRIELGYILRLKSKNWSQNLN